jgi:D-lyxose ketol-isomerase
VDGLRRSLVPGGTLRLTLGESITLEPRCCHKFWGQGRLLVGEVSMVNDDQQDNRF